MSTLVRRTARAIRDAGWLPPLDPVWDLMRGPYTRALRRLAGGRGIGVRVGGRTIHLDPAFATLSWERFEFESYRTFAEKVHPGDIVYDVGAHIGTYTLLALEASSPDGMVVAFEPEETARVHLRRHLRSAGVEERVIICDNCCGSEPGMVEFFHRTGKAEGTSGLLPVEGFERKWTRMTTVDAEVTARGLIPALVKIDVEGAEMDVLKGAEQTIERHRPLILLSIHRKELATLGLDADVVLEWLGKKGYRCRRLGEDHELHVFAEPV